MRAKRSPAGGNRSEAETRARASEKQPARLMSPRVKGSKRSRAESILFATLADKKRERARAVAKKQCPAEVIKRASN